MIEISSLIDSIVREGLAPYLKETRFKKHTRTFTRDAGPCIQIVNMQASQSNDGSEGSFTMNLGVYYPRVAERRGAVAKGSYPKEYDSTLRTRIGALLPTGRDHWWKIKTSTDASEVARVVGDTYRQYGEPWLEWATDLRAILPQVRKQTDLLLAAAVALELGDHQEACAIVREAMQRPNEGYASTARRFGEKHGLVLVA